MAKTPKLKLSKEFIIAMAALSVVAIYVVFGITTPIKSKVGMIPLEEGTACPLVYVNNPDVSGTRRYHILKGELSAFNDLQPFDHSACGDTVKAELYL